MRRTVRKFLRRTVRQRKKLRYVDRSANFESSLLIHTGGEPISQKENRKSFTR